MAPAYRGARTGTEGRVEDAPPFALAGALIFQAFGALVAVLVTTTSSFGAPLAAGTVNLRTGRRTNVDPLAAVVDVALTALVLLAAADRSAAHLAGAMVIGVVLYVAMVLALPSGVLPLTHAAWWIIGMLPAIVLGLLPNLRAVL